MGDQAEPTDVFARRRAALARRMGEGVAIVPAAHEILRNRDVTHPFRQSSDFYYLTGLEEPDAVLALTASRHGAHFCLWVRPRDPEQERWAGPRAGPEGALARYGADEAASLDTLNEGLREVLAPASRLFYELGADPALDRRVVDHLTAFRRKPRERQAGPRELHDVSALLHEQRLVKDEHEIDALRRATDLTMAGMRAAAAALRPGRFEHELRAEIERRFYAAGSARPSFEPIVASGANAAVLHYVDGHRRIELPDLVLVDIGAEVDYLSGDLTRTFPASGRLEGAQRALFAVVSETLVASNAATRPGVRYDEWHQRAVRQLTEGMVSLGLLEGPVDARVEDGTYKRFFPHQLGHFLGMDVHDVGRYRDEKGWRVFAPGMVITVEPGLYVSADAEDVPDAFRGVGVRLEDSVLLTEDGGEVLSAALPRDPFGVAELVGATG